MAKSPRPKTTRGWITSERARAHVQELRHASDAIVTGIGTVLADDPQLDRPQRPAARAPAAARGSRFHAAPAARIAPCAQRERRSARLPRTSAASAERRRALENRGIEVKIFDGPRGRVDIRDVISLLGERRCLSVDDRGRQQGELGRARIGRGG